MALTSHDSAYPNTTLELIIDSHDSALLDEQTTITSTGQTTAWSSYDKNTITNRIPADPPSRLAPACAANGLSYGRPAPGGAIIMTGAAPH